MVENELLNLKTMKISFDFDGTLSRKTVQEYCMGLISLGFDVWVCTARFNEERKHEYLANPTNDDLYQVIDFVGIPLEKVIFTNMEDKSSFLDGFVVHLDDCWSTIYEVNLNSRCHAVACDSSNDWKEITNLILNI